MHLTGSSGEHSLLRNEPATLKLSIAWLVLRLFWEAMPSEMAALTVHIAHGKAAFFSWHRRFISVYEQYLKDKCTYTGALPYWDWTLDWENLPGSPIFSAVAGFGGNGDHTAPKGVGDGHCVTDGPFADLHPLFYGSTLRPHCLSRGFTDFHGRNASPAVVQEVLGSADYETFFLAVENGPHNVAPNGIRGDFYSFTAPYDPIFYLHHAQLDRLWFLWQRKDAGHRLREYTGRTDTSNAASLEDLLVLGGLAPDITVSQVMDTEGAELCYRYSLS
ncbi:uncharacterized protein E0L32_006292 [Thyridium curvatum]|uniref:Tyrosinase copper-binding domain-containing protein n=1 Tax=Thyridium curvatum TaxID=1093900 RepID=A0A507B7D3_9PEZI|nr:uncharacterized protein E0L32_006292 [Thyridium curvatum]TPX13319.1 hypothetical protein E0L32_006292 [Thyridium curvatum]